MGTWGYYPTDSDSALDWNAEIDNSINKKLFELVKKVDEWTFTGLVMIQLQNGVLVKTDFVKKCFDYLLKIREDEEWYKKWGDSKKAKESVRELLKGFKELLDDDGENEFITAPRFWLAKKRGMVKTAFSKVRKLKPVLKAKSASITKNIKSTKQRPSPSDSAALFAVGKKKKGNDGNMWVIVTNKNKIKRWQKV